MSEVDLRYPIGKFVRPAVPLDEAVRTQLIDEIAHLPSVVRGLVRKLSDTQLATPYRPGGWTIRQVVHHLPDSHMHAYIRTKVALTEDRPEIEGYQEARWAELADGRKRPDRDVARAP